MMKFEEIKKVVDENIVGRHVVYDYVQSYNNIVDEKDQLICVNTDSYIFDKFYTMADVIEMVQKIVPISDEEVVKCFNEIGGNQFDIPSLYVVMKKKLTK